MQKFIFMYNTGYPDSKIYGANMGSTWVLSVPGGPHVGLINFVIRLTIPINNGFIW